ncbi:MAG: glycosyltransferase [Deltaproteobacteria bacterium]|nr:glycosyltransferase [Nannocystaceae bacterium]
MISIVIPAYNEGAVIERCLSALLADAKPGELDVVVVCNGCKDDTAVRARKFADRIKVVETPVGSKIGALNLGDEHVSGFPRFYIDADVQLSASAIREVAALLGDDSPVLVAAPRAIVAYEDRPFLVRSFYKVWTSLPYFRENMIGSGVYAFSRRGRAKFERFPDIIADDEWARLMVAPHERRASTGATFTIHPPRTINGVLSINTRARAGSIELRQKFPALVEHQNTSAGRTLQIIARTPRLWAHAPVYLGVMFLAKLKAHEKLRKRLEKVWDRDDTSRSPG